MPGHASKLCCLWRSLGYEMPIRLVLADDHPLILNALEDLFRLQEDFQVVARCMDGEEALQAVRRHQPDVLLLDLRMPGEDGIAVLQAMHQEQLPTRVVILAGELDDAKAVQVMQLGVRGVVLKEMATRQIVQCIRKVYAGGHWLEYRSAGRALERIVQREAGLRQLFSILTPRELEIARLVGSGMRNKRIAEKLSISEGTVKIHLHNIYNKLHVQNRLELALYLRSDGLT
jgi:two-component system, NarL family, nitrate/nitrite response regulator NarL